MKKIYLLTFSLFALFQVKAQTSYTLTQANSEAIIGDSYLPRIIDTTIALPMNISGNNVTWNLTGLTDTLAVDSVKFIDPSADANSGNYAGVTIVQTAGTNVSYYKSSTNQYELLGLDLSFGGQTANINYNTNSAIIAQYNMSYGYTNTDAVSGDISTSGIPGTFTGTVVTEVDGTGTLNLNGMANFANCARVKTTQHLDFDLSGIETGTVDQIIYNYYNSSSKFPVLTVSYNHVVGAGLFPIDNTQVQINTLSTVVIGVKENKLNDVIFKTYPNPANSEISLHFVLAQSESYNVEISNTLGQVVKTITLNNLQPGMYNESINVADLSAGIYNIKLTGKNSQGTEKLVIQK